MTGAEWTRCLGRLQEGWPRPTWTPERVVPYAKMLSKLGAEDVERAIATVIKRTALLATTGVGSFPPAPAELYSLALVEQSRRIKDAHAEAASHFRDQEERAYAEGKASPDGPPLIPTWVKRRGVEWLRTGGGGLFAQTPNPFLWPAGWCQEHEGKAWCTRLFDHEGPHDLQR